MRVLLIAFHYPPVWGSSGVHRTLYFSRYLQELGWTTSVLSIHPRAFPKIEENHQTDDDKNIWVKRAFAVDTARHLALRGRYPIWLAWPDRWVSWWLGAVPTGLSMIKKFKPQIIWSTYPIATAHLIGLTLSRLSGLPWVADFRDSMTEENYPREPTRRRVYRWIERRTVYKASKVVFTAPGTLHMYQRRYPELPETRWCVIPNGYDEKSFQKAEKNVNLRRRKHSHLIVVHSGVLYPSERDPTYFFEALSELKNTNEISAKTIRVILRATGHDDTFIPMLEKYNINDIVSLEPGVGYQEALAEMLTSDGLLLFQASNCNHQIPAKVYEYFRAKRPMLALTDPKGNTADLIKSFGIDAIVKLNDKEDIKQGFTRFITMLRNGQTPLTDEKKVHSYSRMSQTQKLSDLLKTLISEQIM